MYIIDTYIITIIPIISNHYMNYMYQSKQLYENKYH